MTETNANVAPGVIAKKVGMTRMVDSEGRFVAVTLLKVEDQKVTKVCTPEKDGYHAIQVGYYPKREILLNKPDIARLRKNGVEENYSKFREFRLMAESGLTVGSALTAETFTDVTAVDVMGVTKGRGFQGATKRWNAKTGRRTHGSRFHRRPGSLGQRSTPGRVFKNKKMPGHMGASNITTQNLKVLDVDNEKGLIALKGSVPGHNQGHVVLMPSIKIKVAKADK